MVTERGDALLSLGANRRKARDTGLCSKAWHRVGEIEIPHIETGVSQGSIGGANPRTGRVQKLFCRSVCDHLSAILVYFPVKTMF